MNMSAWSTWGLRMYWLPKNEATPEKSGAKRGSKEETQPFGHVRNSKCTFDRFSCVN